MFPTKLLSGILSVVVCCVTEAQMLLGRCLWFKCTEPFGVWQMLYHQALMLFGLSLEPNLSPVPHPIYKAVGICLCFLLRDGSLTLMKMASLTDLAKYWSSLPMMLKLSTDISWPVVLWWSWMGDGAFMCSLYLSAYVVPDSPIHSSS